MNGSGMPCFLLLHRGLIWGGGDIINPPTCYNLTVMSSSPHCQVKTCLWHQCGLAGLYGGEEGPFTVLP